METTTEIKNEQNNPLKKWVITLAILAGVFFATTLYFGFFAKPVFNTQYVQATTENESLQSELDSLLAEHDKIKAEYGELSEQLSEKDSIIMVNADEIKKLINSQADYKKIKKQLARLQNIAKEYVDEMDKLYQENQALKQENTQVKESLAQEQEKSATYQQEKENLNAKISTAAVLKAYNIYSRAVYYKSRNSSEVITEKASKSKKFKTSLILGENSLIEPGPVNIYCRIAVPETGRVLSPGSSDAYTFNNNGQQLQYTAKTTINYTNKAENVTLFWDIRDGDKVAKGKYIVEIFSDNGFLGETSFELD
jgi:cell division protein FtsB